MQNYYSIKVFVKKVTLDDGRKFNTFFTKLKDGKTATVKFTRNVELPKASVELIVPIDKINRNVYDNNGRERVVFWISEVTETKELERPIEDLSQYFDNYTN